MISASTTKFKSVSFDGFTEAPRAWFNLLEIQFLEAGIVNQNDQWIKAAIGLAKCKEIATRVSDLLEAREDKDPYTKLKRNVLERLERSAEAKLEALIDATDRGDCKPSDYLRKLRSLAPTSDVSEKLVKRALLKSLPSQLRLILETISNSQSLDEVAKIADQIIEKQPNMVDEINNNVKPVNNHDSQIAELRAELEALKARDGPRQTRKPKYKKRETHDRNGVCYFHQKFKSKARKCLLPCTYKADTCDQKN